MTGTLPTPKPLTFDLKYRKVATPYERPRVGQQWDKEEWGEKDEERFAALPDKPLGFIPLTGAWSLVTSRADFLNLQQQRAGFVDWFFWPEATPSEMDPAHCDVCTRIRADRDL